MIQLACSGSYVPTARAMAAAGYGAEPADNQVRPEGGQVLVEATLQGLHALWEG